MNYYDNLAYDFDLFSNEKTTEVIEIPDNDKLKAQKTAAVAKPRAASKLKSVLYASAVTAVVIVMIFLQINCMVKTTETTDEIYNAKITVERLKSEETRLQAELGNKVSFENIEKTADEIGMQKPTSVQTRYITINDSDTVQVVEEKSLIERLLAMF